LRATIDTVNAADLGNRKEKNGKIPDSKKEVGHNLLFTTLVRKRESKLESMYTPAVAAFSVVGLWN